jgi:hypothetical protein
VLPRCHGLILRAALDPVLTDVWHTDTPLLLPLLLAVLGACSQVHNVDMTATTTTISGLQMQVQDQQGLLQWADGQVQQLQGLLQWADGQVQELGHAVSTEVQHSARLQAQLTQVRGTGAPTNIATPACVVHVCARES